MERDPIRFGEYRVDGRKWVIGGKVEGRIQVWEYPSDTDHHLRKTKLLLLYPNQLKRALKGKEVLHAES